jgi:hypothetical protein
LSQELKEKEEKQRMILSEELKEREEKKRRIDTNPKEKRGNTPQENFSH